MYIDEIESLVGRFEKATGKKNGWSRINRANLCDTGLVRRYIDVAVSDRRHVNEGIADRVKAVSDRGSYIRNKNSGLDAIRACIATRINANGLRDIAIMLFEVRELKQYRSMGATTWGKFCSELLHATEQDVNEFIKQLMKTEINVGDIFKIGDIVRGSA